MRTHRWMILALAVCLVAVAAPTAVRAEDEGGGEDEADKILYALGLVMSQRLSGMEFSEAEAASVTSGLTDGLLGRDVRVELDVYGPKIDPMLSARLAKLAEKQKPAAAAFVEKAAGEPGALRTDSGVIFIEIAAGDGAQPSARDAVKLHFRGTLIDGTEFDTSIGSDPERFRLSAVIPCFSEGAQRMRVGGKSKLVCPSDTAYGEQGLPPLIRPGATLIFDLELLEVVGATAPAPGK